MATYHSGERAVQERAGLGDQARFSLGGIHNAVPEVAAAFLATQPMIVIGAPDAEGRLWATQLVGQPGFLSAPEPDRLVVETLPQPGDPLADAIADANPRRPLRVGAIAIEPATRRRMRLNGRAVTHGGRIEIDLDQVIANCPKYIQKRQPVHRADTPPPQDRRVTDSTALSQGQQDTIRAADTFFVATASDSGDADASHRGGNPGFVDVLSPTTLRWPDYIGNAMFLTLGNLAVNSRAGLVFPGWDTGTALHLTGTARTVWDPGALASFPGAQRLVEFSIDAVREITNASPLRWSEPAFSRFNPPPR
ncbi:pyridoxamine 5'-phosphate oxidase family protein [Saccharomonospora xinjiangensis]|uniref:Pyridoxamine 5'-phosphate oxidase-related, FMN binding protein n=1 Tax=Saccharomonospora xinjiangensis XJ-54 TaxID=882086 RepID=I0V874_9PSEU|nr:pyridoxamine 5'-phosphate oxidase family protein [Saccharomonospora xinjiangensis]EID56327.1 pyridoxamine 5'-phosphate oxidase-related, FMN binding protein [Saccharomonospora xinjiangensis XJ-54]